MYQTSPHLPIILMLDGPRAADCDSVKNWFRKSRFLTCEADDIFQAMEEILDFTVRERPEIVLVDAKQPVKESAVLQEAVETAPGEASMPVIFLSECGRTYESGDSFEVDYAKLLEQLDKLVPDHSVTFH